MNKKWIVTCYKTDCSWIDKYTDNYIIYDKSGELQETDKIHHQPNVGYNIYSILYFIVNNYDNLPDICVFIKSNVFKHCEEKIFRKLIKSNTFTPLEFYGMIPANNYESRTPDGGFLEINNDWYIQSHIETYGKETQKYLTSYNQFLDIMFDQPEHPAWIRFAPGGNYIVPRKNILFYSKTFWENIMLFVDYHQIPVEAHIVERALYYIFSNKWSEHDYN